uniref:Gamma-aminobutyric acid receptor subunit beta n=1 Tax=Dugesia japonica TaxID=6161 RepID=A0A2Z5X785_DUGJA|nr:gamma-aminobutyric acid receptor subunit beta A [Dugesia japonica]
MGFLLWIYWNSISILGFFIGLNSSIQNFQSSNEYDHLKNASVTISNLMKNYDSRLRPKFGSGPMSIDMELVVASFDSISEVNMDYTITLYLNQYWQDERLAFNASHAGAMITMPGDFSNQIWVPDTFLANDKYSFLHDVTEKNKMLRIYGDGKIFYGMRFTTTLACMMDLHYYPLDEQNCTVEIESYGYPLDDVKMSWKNGRNAVHNIENIHMIQFTINSYDVHTLVSNLSTGLYQRLSLCFQLHRNVGFFVFQTYLPSILIVMLSWVSFWISHEATSARVALGITTVLTMTTISTGVRSSLPRISYVKAIDVYLVVCFVFVFSALLEYAAVNYTFWGERAKQKKKKLKENYDRSRTNLTKLSQPLFPDDMNNDLFLFNSENKNNEVVFPKTSSPDHNLYSCHREYQASGFPHNRIKSCSYTSNSVNSKKFRSSKNYRKFMHKFSKKYSSGINDYFEEIPMSASIEHTEIFNNQKTNTNPRQSNWKSQFCQSKSKHLHLPKVRNIKIIDKFSRILFPICFLLFNICYFCIYSL